MNKHAVRFVVDLTIHAGKLAEFEKVANAMITLSQKEPGTLGYDWCLSGDRTRCRIVEHFADANATVAHSSGATVQEWVPRLMGVANLNRFEVYGDPGPKAAEMLAGFGAETFGIWRGVNR